MSTAQHLQSSTHSAQTAVHLAVLSAFLVGMIGHSAPGFTQTQSASTDTTLAAGASRYNPVIPQNAVGSKSVTVLDGAYAGNAKVGRINVTVKNAAVPADGQSLLELEIEVFDLSDTPMKMPVLVTVEASGGRLQLQGAATDEFGPGRRDADRLIPGTQVRVENGRAYFGLIAPNQAQDVTIRLTVGSAEVTGVVPFNPDVREMIAAGLIEGSLRLSKKSYGSTISPVRLEDGFEQEITRFSRSNSSTSGLNATDKVLAARAAIFLKGKISGESLLTLSFDSDKETRARLLRDIKPDDMYPVYGDASIKGFDARSSDRLYVRVDNKRSFIMYGDFNTGSGFSQSAGTGVVAGSNLRQLATYNRSMTGVRGHVESENGFVSAFVSRDTLKSETEELRANGTSGPFAIQNSTALENSEKIELIVRDRNNLNAILSVTQLQRLNDYVFEPFSGRILFSRAIPSFDANGNPLSLRISYEADQGGKNFFVAGVDGQLNLGKNVVVGGVVVEDKNPLAPSRLVGVNAGVKLGNSTTLVGEIAQSRNGITPVSGNAARLELAHEGQVVQAKVYINRKDVAFNNQSNGAINGVATSSGEANQQVGASVNVNVSASLGVNATVQQNTNTVNEASTRSIALGANYAINDRITARAAVRQNEEQGVLANTLSGIGCNPQPGSTFGNSGLSGANSPTLLNVNGVSNCVAQPSSTALAGSERSSQTLQLGVDAKVTDKLTVSASVEGGTSKAGSVSNDQATRVELGASYQVAERTRLYARADTQRGLSSQYSLDSVNKSQSVSLGIDSTYMQGGNVFSEYRLRDSVSGQESQVAGGLRNVWQLSDGVMLSTGLERLKLISGQGQNATALTAGLDYTQSEVWKAGGRVELRRLDGSSNNTAINQQDTLLFTLNASRKLERDWTLLARNYYMATKNYGVTPNGWQDRFQVGAAYRPVDHNALDMLTKFEYKLESNINGLNEKRTVAIAATQVNYHPSRAWWMSARSAAKYVNETLPTNATSNYKAYLVGGRLIYDITENIDLGLNLGLMYGKGDGQAGASYQKGLGLEIGYRVATNLWATLGYNFAGYTDKDLASDYTSKGGFLKLRYKFDQDLFQSGNPNVNNILEPARSKP